MCVRGLLVLFLVNALCPLLHPEVPFFFFHGSRRDSRDMRMEHQQSPCLKKFVKSFTCHSCLVAGAVGGEERREEGAGGWIGGGGFWKGWVKGSQRRQLLRERKKTHEDVAESSFSHFPPETLV